MTNNEIIIAALNIADRYGLKMNLSLHVYSKYFHSFSEEKMVHNMSLTGSIVPAKNGVKAGEDTGKTTKELFKEQCLLENILNGGLERAFGLSQITVKARHHQYLLELFNVRCAEFAGSSVKEMSL